MFNQSMKFLLAQFIAMHLLFIGVLFFVLTSFEEPLAPFSPESLSSPFFGEHRMLVVAFNLLLVFDLAWLLTSIIPNAVSRPQARPLALVLPEMFTLVGFVIGFLEFNFWIILPYAAFGLGILFYSYSRLTEKQ